MQPQKTQLGSRPAPQQKNRTWVQTDRAAHEAWGQMVRRNPRAAALLHVLCAHMDNQAAVVASRATLASLAGYSEATVKRAVADLKAGRWIQVVQLGGKGGVNAYVVNSNVAWADNRDKISLAVFSARVIATREEQSEPDDNLPLRRIPTLYRGEQQVAAGDGEEPPSQPFIDGLEPDLPYIDKETGEIFDVIAVDRTQPFLPGEEE